MAEVKWIKIATQVFDNRKIKQIEKMPDGDSVIVIWFKLLCLAGNINEGGMIYFTKEMPYTDEMLATEFNRPLQTIRLALSLFQQFKMIEIIDDVYYISSWEKYQNVEGLEKIREQTKKRVARHREKQKKLLGCNVTSNADVTQGNAIEEDIEEELDIDISSSVSTPNPHMIYEQNIGTLSPLTAERIEVAIKDIGEDLVCYAIEQAVQYNKKSWKYIEAIVLAWKQNNFKSRVDVDNSKPKFKEQSGKPNKFINFEQRDLDYEAIEKKAMEMLLKENEG